MEKKAFKSQTSTSRALALILVTLTFISASLLQSCKKEEREITSQLTKEIDKSAVKEWIAENPISQIVEPNWDSLQILTTKTGLQIAKLPVTATNILGSPNPANVLIKKGMIKTSTSGENNPNFSDTYPPQIFFTRDENGKLKAHFLNFVPEDKGKENGANGLWTGKAYEWNMTGDTMLTIEYIKSKVHKGTFQKYGAIKSKNNSSTTFSTSQSVRQQGGTLGAIPGGIGNKSIWEWLANLVGDIWTAMHDIGYFLGIPGAENRTGNGIWPYDVRSWDWSWLDSNNQPTTDYIAGDPNVMGLFFNGNGYIIPPATGFDRLIIKLGISDLGAQQALNLRPDIQTAITNYLNQNGDSALNLEYASWAQAYLIANPGEDASVFIPNNMVNYYTNAEMESIFNSIDEPLTGDPVEFYMVLAYKNPKYFDLLRYNADPNKPNVGSYYIGTYRDKSGTIVCYTAARSGYNGIEFVIKPGQLSLFTAKVSEFTEAADNFYRQGKPSIGWIQTLSGDRWAGFISIWADAIKSPTWWAYAITSFGHAITRLPNSSVGSVTPAPNWRVSMKKMTGDSFQGRAVTNPQGATVTINIPDNYVPSLSNNGQGINFRPNPAIGTHPDAGLIRIMAPTVDKPNGYAVFYNANGQPFNPLNNQTLGSSNWHFEF